VSVPARGELDYFSWNFDKGQGWFFSQFFLEKNNRFYIDISPSYLSSPEAPLRIFNLEPTTKIILIVRNPIHRAYSHYCMLLRGGAIGENIDEEIFKCDRIIQDGKYCKYLRQYRELFGPESIYVGFFDDLSLNPQMFLSELLNWIGVDYDFRPSILNRAFHFRRPRPKYQLLYNLAVKLNRTLTAPRSMWWLAKLVRELRKRDVFGPVHRLNEGPGLPTLGDDAVSKLTDLYREEVTQLQNWTGRDLSGWVECDW
jgi:hypothetical protein